MINKTFRSFQQNKSTGFIPYIVGGHPNESIFLQSLNLLDQMGADMIEVGVPFSDPIAEGKTIEQAHHYSLQNNFKIDELLSIIQNFRKHSKTPIILMGYTNSFIQPSIDNFCKNAKDVGINGFLIVDLPYSETEIINTIHKHSLETIQLIAPTSSKENIELGLSNNPSLIYYITQRGVTGLSNINMSLFLGILNIHLDFSNLIIFITIIISILALLYKLIIRSRYKLFFCILAN